MDGTDDEPGPETTGDQPREDRPAAEIDPSTETVRELIETGEASAYLDQCRTEPVEQRKRLLQSCETIADDQPAQVAPLCPTLRPFLDDDDRSVRLCATKLFVTVAEGEPAAVVDTIPALADRLRDDDELSYVRARAAEALGYVALDHPEAVASPEIIAELRVGLRFGESELREKLAKALEHVALGDPSRLRHEVSRLAEQLDDENELVRYHLTSALVVIGEQSPEQVADVTQRLTNRLDDDNHYVRGRSAEALGVVREAVDGVVAAESLGALTSEEPQFVTERARYALGERAAEHLGSREGVRASTGEAVEAITSPDTDGECPRCGTALPANGPPTCPGCGSPY